MAEVQLHSGEAAKAFLARTRDAESRSASVRHFLRQIFADVAPSDLTSTEAAELVRVLEPVFHRVTGDSVSRGAARVPRIGQLQDVLAAVSPADLTAAEALVVLTVLIPVHSRVLERRHLPVDGRPRERFVITQT